MSSRFSAPDFDAGSGIQPKDGAKLSFFESGTSTDKDTFSDSALSTLNANPVIADSNGVFPDIFLEGGSYKVTLTDKNDVQVGFGEADPVEGFSSGSQSSVIFTTKAAMTASKEISVGGSARTLGYTSVNDGGDGFYNIVGAGTGTADAGEFIDLTGITGQARLVHSGRISSIQYGTTGATGDTAKLQLLINNTNAKIIEVESYSPIDDECFVDRSDVEFDFKYKSINMTGIAKPVLVLGQQANGTVSTSSQVNIEVNNVVSSGDKTAGSRIVRYRKASTCKFHNWRAAGCATPFDGEGVPGGAFESIACEFYNLDLRGNTNGFLDLAGSFQGSTFFGCRIEQNDNEGIHTNSPNLNFVGSVIEGNGSVDTTRHEVRVLGGGSINFVNCYFEVALANTASSVVLVDPASTKRINFVNCDIFGNNGTNPRRVVAGSDWVTGSVAFSGGNINDCEGYVTRAGAAGNWVAFLDSWSNTALEDASTQINGAAYFQNDRVLGALGEKATYSGRVQAENTLITEAASGSFVKQFSRFMGTIAASGVGTWHIIASVTDLGGSASTALTIELIFGARQGDFRWKDAITINGTTTVTKIGQVYGNWSSNLYRINAGNLETDNIPASSRQFAVGILSQKTSTA